MEKIKYAVVSFDEGSIFHELWPYVSRCWREVCGITPVGLMLSDSSSDFIQDEFGYLKQVSPAKSIHLTLQAQTLRIYGMKYISELGDGLAILSDGDMLPINSNFINSGLSFYEKGKIVSYYRDLLGPLDQQIPICYNLGLASDFCKILHLNSFDTFSEYLEFLTQKYANEYNKFNSTKKAFGWSIDQRFLYDEAELSVDRFVFMKLHFEAKMRRLDRSTWPSAGGRHLVPAEEIRDKKYTDCHFFNLGLTESKRDLLTDLINVAKQ